MSIVYLYRVTKIVFFFLNIWNYVLFALLYLFNYNYKDRTNSDTLIMEIYNNLLKNILIYISRIIINNYY